MRWGVSRAEHPLSEVRFTSELVALHERLLSHFSWADSSHAGDADDDVND